MPRRDVIVKRPQQWDLVLACAYLRILGHTQEEAAKAAGVDRTTLQRWEKSPLWKEAEDEAHQRFCKGAAALSRKGIEDCLKDKDEKAAMSRWVAERLFPEFAPPTIRSEIAARVEAKVEVSTAKERVISTIDRLAAALPEKTGTGDSE